MPPATERSNKALVVIDVQNDVVAHAHDRSRILANISNAVDAARSAAVPVIWVQHADEDLPADTPGWEIVSELDPQDGEPVVHKHHRDSFDGTTLEAELKALDIGHLVVTGSQSDFCVRWTLHGAQTRGYLTTLVGDAHTTDDPPTEAMPSASQTIEALNRTWATDSAGGGVSAVSDAADLVF